MRKEGPQEAWELVRMKLELEHLTTRTHTHTCTHHRTGSVAVLMYYLVKIFNMQYNPAISQHKGCMQRALGMVPEALCEAWNSPYSRQIIDMVGAQRVDQGREPLGS